MEKMNTRTSQSSGKMYLGLALVIIIFCFFTAPITGYAATYDNFNDFLTKDLKLPSTAIDPTSPSYQSLQQRWEATRPSYMQYRASLISTGLITANQEIPPNIGMPMSQWLGKSATQTTYLIDTAGTTT